MKKNGKSDKPYIESDWKKESFTKFMNGNQEDVMKLCIDHYNYWFDRQESTNHYHWNWIENAISNTCKNYTSWHITGILLVVCFCFLTLVFVLWS